MTGAPGQGRHRLDIQALRALAVGLVVLWHVGVPGMPGGFVGVDVFFVISGFLMVQLLVRELDRTGGLRVGAFYYLTATFSRSLGPELRAGLTAISEARDQDASLQVPCRECQHLGIPLPSR